MVSLTDTLIVLFEKFCKLFISTLQGLLGFYGTYDLNLTLTYQMSQQVTHDLIKQFYNDLIFHQQFIKNLTNLKIEHTLKVNLANITGELDHNIVCLYHLVSFLYVSSSIQSKYLIWFLTYDKYQFCLLHCLHCVAEHHWM